MNSLLNRYINILKKYFNPFVTLSFGVFLFILFFQPFPEIIFDSNDKLVFIAGFGLITFLSFNLIKIISIIFFHEADTAANKSLLPSVISNFAIFTISSLAFAFYLRFVGQVDISFFIMLRILLICLSATAIMAVYELIKALRQHNEELIREKKFIQKQLEKYEEDYLNKSIEFSSETGTDSLKLLVAEVAYIKSADNYVEIVYHEGEAFKKKLIRNTLRGIEQQIKPYSNFVRCHRICIINSHFIEYLNKNYGTYSLSLKGHDERIPVSRQYLLKIKELI